MTDVNEAFMCGCGSTRFVELTQWNRLSCRLESDPERAPTTILCWACRRVYKQATDWSWTQMPAMPQTKR